MAAPTRPVPPVRLFQAYEEEEVFLGEELDAEGSALETDEVTCNDRGRCSDDDDVLDVVDVALGTQDMDAIALAGSD